MSEVSVPVKVSSSKGLNGRSRRRLVIAGGVAVIVSILLAVGYLVIDHSSRQLAASGIISVTPKQSLATNASATVPVAKPISIKIASLSISSTLEAVGQLTSGEMSPPTLLEQPAWYRKGFMPGENGSAVIAGHLDGVGNKIGVFANLNQITIGDSIVISDENKTVRTFKVTGKESFPYNRAPIEQLFGSSSSKLLRLITCDGRWLRGEQTYGERLVITSVLTNVKYLN